MSSLPWYLAVYETNDTESLKKCTAILLYGTPNWRKGNPTECDESLKHVKLYCPTCKFVHLFKRTAWIEEHIITEFGGYQIKPAR